MGVANDETQQTRSRSRHTRSTGASVSQNLLSDDDIAKLTGYERPGLQAQWLEGQRIKHYINAKGQVVVPAVALLRPLSETGNTEPDFGQFDAQKKSA
jgi:hypothetical protein